MKMSGILTVQVLLLGSNHLLCGRLADGLGESLPRETVPRRKQPVVDSLPVSGHFTASLNLPEYPRWWLTLSLTSLNSPLPSDFSKHSPTRTHWHCALTPLLGTAV